MATNYSNYISSKGSPVYKKEERANHSLSGLAFGNGKESRYVIGNSYATKGDSEFDGLMSGLDDVSDQYVTKMQSIFDGYGKYVDQYDGAIQPIVDALNDDIEVMGGYVDNYDELLNKNKDAFLNGIALDPNAKRTQSEYMGAVADEYGNAREAQKRNMVSQGLNPYANKGADRQLRMNEAKDKGMAHGIGYSDWRKGYNQDKLADANLKSTFINMQGKGIDGQSAIMNARRGIGDFQGNILSSRLQAGNQQAAGYQGLLSHNEGRRTEALELQKNKANKDTENLMARNQMTEGLMKSGNDAWRVRI